MAESGVYLVLALGALAISASKDRAKTRQALWSGVKTFSNLLPLLLFIFTLMGISQAYVSKAVIAAALGGTGLVRGVLLGAAIGTVALIAPAAIFPVAGFLKGYGANPGAIGALILSAVLIGITSIPYEVRIFGWRFALSRNIVTFLAAVVCGIAIGLTMPRW